MSISNTADRIAELRTRIRSNRGKIDRAHATMNELSRKISTCNAQIWADREEIRDMGGKVK